MSQAIIVMGVAASGKRTVGKALAEHLGWHFFDGDDYHSPANRQRMATGQPLADTDREPWLEQLHNLLVKELTTRQSVVLACSALKRSYRAKLTTDLENVKFVYLKGVIEIIRTRMEARPDHFMKPGMLESQFVDLEEPSDAIIPDIKPSVDLVVSQIVNEIGKQKSEI